MQLSDLYMSIVDEVLENVREVFAEEGHEQTLKTLREAWVRRIRDSQQPRQANALRTAQQQQPPAQIQAPPTQQQQPPAQLLVVQPNSDPLQKQQQQQQQQQQQLVPTTMNKPKNITQLDGSSGSSEEEDEDLDEENEEESDGEFQDADLSGDDDDDKESAGTRDNEDPLNSGDDVSNEDSSEMFETDNVVVCQYDKITRNRNKWKFHLKDGVMNINGRDYVFQKAIGDAEW